MSSILCTKEEEPYMAEKNEVMKENKGKTKLIKKYLNSKVIITLVVILVLVVGAIGMKKYFFTESKTTKIGFEDIGELATQAAYCTEVDVIDASRKLFGVKIPFTQSKYIYSYDVVVKAGFDFSDIEWWIENDTIVMVKLPKAKILGCEIDTDSFKVYHEDESIFKQITLEETNESMSKLKKQAEADAIANGILENARNNAETILTGFFGNAYDLETYEIKFVDK